MALPPIRVDEPTIAMIFGVNTSPSPAAKASTSPRASSASGSSAELRTNVAMRVEDTDSPDAFQVSGRGELQLAILIETMRREGYELQVSQARRSSPSEIDGEMHEPIELLVIDVPEEYIGVVIAAARRRARGRMTKMMHHGTGRVRLEFSVPSRGLIGFRSSSSPTPAAPAS